MCFIVLCLPVKEINELSESLEKEAVEITVKQAQKAQETCPDSQSTETKSLQKKKREIYD